MKPTKEDTMLIAAEIFAERRAELKEQRLRRLVDLICWGALILAAVAFATAMFVPVPAR